MNKSRKETGGAPDAGRGPAAEGRRGEGSRPTHDEHLLQAPPHQIPPFVQSDPWRVLRIMGEFVSGFEDLAELGPAVTIFGSARTRPGTPVYEQTVETARKLGQAGFTIITGGGPGIMEAGNKGAVEAGVESVGLGIELPFEQTINEYVTLPIAFRYFFARKTMFLKYAQAYVIFPGGFGTMDELMESLTLVQTGKVQNFPIILFGSEYWRGLLAWLEDTMLAAGNISPEDLKLMRVTDSPDEVVAIVERSFRENNGEHRRVEEQAQAAARRAWRREQG